jgi:hypothetical protein
MGSQRKPFSEDSLTCPVGQVQNCSTGQGDYRLKVILLSCIICVEILAEKISDEI